MAGAQALTLAALAAVGGVTAVAVTDAELRDGVAKIAEEVADARGLPAPRALERRLVSRGEAEAARDAALEATVGGPDAVARARLWERLGLLPEGADYPALVARSLGAPAASYDVVRRRLTVPSWIPLVEQQTALAHELAHAVADQRFGLRQLLGIGLDGHHALDGDAERARLALIEGDASVAALERMDPRGAFQSRPELTTLAERLRAAPPTSTPSWIRAGAIFAHAEGLLFVGRVRARAPWTAVNALWEDPPASSEQVLHPEKYLAREKPVMVTIAKPPALGEAWKEAASDVLGELGVRTWLGLAAPRALAERAAAGWGGDRAALYEPVAPPPHFPPDAGVADAGVPPPPRPFVAWSTVWDDVTDADDFARNAAPVLAVLSGDAAAATPDDPDRVVARRGPLVWALARRGAAVTLLLGAPESALAAIEELLPPAVAPGKKGKLARPGAGVRPK
jgi:hypothetical protein